MNLFEFLRKIAKEQFDVQTRYFDSTSSFEVHVDAIYEKWTISFDSNGNFSGYTRYQEVETDVDDQDALAGLFDRPRKAWEEAAKDLGITFLGPYKFCIEGDWYSVTGLLPDFGSQTGTLILSRNDSDIDSHMASSTDFNISGLSSYHYDRYDRHHFIEALSEWGWCGKGNPPSWFKGKITSK